MGSNYLLLLRAYYVPDTVLGALHTFDFIQSSFQPYEVDIIVVTDSVEEIAKTQLAKEQNRDSAFTKYILSPSILRQATCTFLFLSSALGMWSMWFPSSYVLSTQSV